MSVSDDDLVSIERALASHPEFSDATLITLKAVEFYRFALDLLCERSATVDRLAAEIRDTGGQIPVAVTEDPLVRVTLDEAVSRLEQGFIDEAAWNEVTTMLRLVGDALSTYGTTAAPTGAGLSGGRTVRVAPERDVWLCGTGEGSTEPLTRTFRRDFLRGVPGDLVQPTQEYAGQLDAGFAADRRPGRGRRRGRCARHVFSRPPVPFATAPGSTFEELLPWGRQCTAHETGHHIEVLLITRGLRRRP